MLSMILLIPAGVAVLVTLAIVAVLIFASTKPDTVHYERSAVLDAPADVVHGLINDFHAWEPWSPWEKLDPNIKRTYGDPSAGVGAKYAWAGDKNVGEGRMTIVESRPGELVRIKLEFIKPFAATNEAKFILEPVDGGTKVTWTMDGENLFMGKVMSIFMDMDKMIGTNFEKGLADMGKVAQAKVAGT
jgi:hypothetical protein